MKYGFIFTLLDGSVHGSRREALEHCDTQIVAELRDMLNSRVVCTMVEFTREILVNLAYERAVRAAAEWFAEREAVKAVDEENRLPGDSARPF